MSKGSEMDRLWSEMKKCDIELTMESRVCAKTHSVTARYKKLKADMEKLKTEYEKVKGGGTYNPNSLAHGEAMTRNNVLRKFLGQSGPDSHGSVQKT